MICNYNSRCFFIDMHVFVFKCININIYIYVYIYVCIYIYNVYTYIIYKSLLLYFTKKPQKIDLVSFTSIVSWPTWIWTNLHRAANRSPWHGGSRGWRTELASIDQMLFCIDHAAAIHIWSPWRCRALFRRGQRRIGRISFKFPLKFCIYTLNQ